jgi:hypothetical protein
MDPFRTLQQTLASDHVTADTDVWVLLLAFGHASLRTTQRSAHPKPSHRPRTTTRE